MAGASLNRVSNVVVVRPAYISSPVVDYTLLPSTNLIRL